jgi:predicted phage-related endonuclease
MRENYSQNISASRGSAILGLSKWNSPVGVWLQIMESREPGFCVKNGYKMPEFEYTPEMRWGHAFESSVINLAERTVGHKILDCERFYSFEEFITCHIDGIYKYQKGEESPVLHEGKTTNSRYFRDNFGEPGTDRVPTDYQVQCQHQMICTGAEKVVLSVLVFPKMVDEWEKEGIIPEQEKPGGEWFLTREGMPIAKPIYWAKPLLDMGFFHQYRIFAHNELQKKMIHHYREFWEKYVLTGTPPEPQTYDDIKALCPEPVGTIIADDRVSRLMHEYKMIGEEISGSGTMAKRREHIKVEVLKYMMDTAGITDDESRTKWVLRDQSGKKLVSWGANKSGVKIFR